MLNRLGVLDVDPFAGDELDPPPLFVLALTAALEHCTATMAGVLRDRRSWRLGSGGLLASLRRLPGNPLFSARFRARLADYYRADFHPLDHDSTEVERAWRAWFERGGERPVVAPAA